MSHSFKPPRKLRPVFVILAFHDEVRKTLDAFSELFIVYVPIGEIMALYLKPGVPHGEVPHEPEQQILSHWISDQTAFKEVLSKLPMTDESFSPIQIDAILGIRRKITETKHSHD